MATIAPSILSADFNRLGEQISEAVKNGAEYIHFDVMDGAFVPNISIGIPVLKSVSESCDVPLDVHLMIENPENHIQAFADNGANIITVHQESTTHLDRLLHFIKETKAKAGVAINPATPVSFIEPVLPLADLVLVMSVNPGFGGQKFIPHCLDKIKRLKVLRESKNLNYLIEVDGGVNISNVKAIAAAGADILVAGSSVFNAQNSVAENMRQLLVIQ